MWRFITAICIAISAAGLTDALINDDTAGSVIWGVGLLAWLFNNQSAE